LAGFVGFVLDFAPVRVIAEVQSTEMIDRLLKSIAWPRDENANGFYRQRTGATVRSGNIHRFCVELSSGWVRKPKNIRSPTVKREWRLKVGYHGPRQLRWYRQRVWCSRWLVVPCTSLRRFNFWVSRCVRRTDFASLGFSVADLIAVFKRRREGRSIGYLICEYENFGICRGAIGHGN
jgi:hypothetical protein